MVERKKNMPFPPREAAVQNSENRGERIENKLSKEKLQQEKNVKISTKCLHNGRCACTAHPKLIYRWASRLTLWLKKG